MNNIDDHVIMDIQNGQQVWVEFIRGEKALVTVSDIEFDQPTGAIWFTGTFDNGSEQSLRTEQILFGGTL